MGAKDNPQVTVLTACFNADVFLEESIQSVLRQTFPDFEYILIDDGSTDNTLSLIKKYADQDARIRWLPKANTGLTDSLNLGLSMAQGKWIARLDADDISLENRLRRQLEVALSAPEIVLVGCGCLEIGHTGNRINLHHYPTRHQDLVNCLEKHLPFFPHSAAFFKREQAVAVGGYNLRFKRSQDWDLWHRLSSVGRLACVPEPLVSLRRHQETLSVQDLGHLQQTMGMAATICHELRKAGYKDPSQQEQAAWDEFINWLTHRLVEIGYYDDMALWQKICWSWFTTTETSKIQRLLKVFKLLALYPAPWRFAKTIKHRVGVINKLSKEILTTTSISKKN